MRLLDRLVHCEGDVLAAALAEATCHDLSNALARPDCVLRRADLLERELRIRRRVIDANCDRRIGWADRVLAEAV